MASLSDVSGASPTAAAASCARVIDCASRRNITCVDTKGALDKAPRGGCLERAAQCVWPHNAAAQAVASPRDCVSARRRAEHHPRLPHIKANAKRYPPPARVGRLVNFVRISDPDLQFGGSDAAFHRGAT